MTSTESIRPMAMTTTFIADDERRAPCFKSRPMVRLQNGFGREAESAEEAIQAVNELMPENDWTL
jgi:hypothetical protein